MRPIAEFVAVLACGLFAGAAVYVSLVEHPARMECGVEIAVAQFPPSYHRGTIMQVTLAAVCLLSSIAAWLAGATFWWVVAGVLQVSDSGGMFLLSGSHRPSTKPLLFAYLRVATAGLLTRRYDSHHRA